MILQASREAVFIINGTQIFTCNDYAEVLFGYRIDEMIGKSFLSFFSDADHEKLQKVLTMETEHSMEALAIKNDRSTFNARIYYTVIRSGQSRYHSFCIRDVTQNKQSEKELLARDALLESISFTAARFLESKNWRNEMGDVLKNIGESARVSRVYIFKNFRDEKGMLYMSQQFEWVADQVAPEIDNPVLERLYYHENGLERLIGILSAGKIYKGIVRELPENERQVLEAQEILSIFITPIFQNGQWWGFIGYDECNYEREWNANEIQLLKTAADIFTSVLERESIEEEIIMANKNFKSLFHQSPDGIFVYDQDGFVLDANDAGCRLNGLSAEQLKGMHVSDLVPEAIREQVKSDFHSWATGKIKKIESQSLNAEGKAIPVEIHGANIHYFNKSAILLLVRDISERKKSEAMLEKRIAFIQFISQISSEFIKMKLKDIDNALNKALKVVCEFAGIERGYVFQLNDPETLLNLTNEFCEAGFRPHQELMDSFHVSDFKTFFNVLKSGEYIISHTDELTDDDENSTMRNIQQKLEVKSSIRIPLIVADYFLGYIGFDATRQKTIWDSETINAFMLTGQIIANTIIRKKNEDEIIEAKNRAEQSDRLKTAFLGQMSHEMRTPLNSIIGFAEILERDLQHSDLQEMVGYIIQGGNRLLNTFNLVIDLSEIEANVMQAQMQNINLNRFLEKILPLFTKRAGEKNLILDLIKKVDNISISADHSLLEKVVNNLVDNALKYTNKGSISIITETERTSKGEFAVLKVRDTGIGINTDKIKEVFSNFRQASEGYNREFEGAGLGLSVTRGMVELMGGEISVESKIAKGSEFRISFPLMAMQEDSKGGVHKNDKAPGQRLPRILVVEDEIAHQKYIHYILNDHYDLTIIQDGAAAIEITNRIRFDLIILDINLGKELNGMEAVKKIRQQRGYAKIPIIASTANALKRHKELFLSKGFTHYLAKPYRAKDLKEMVDNILKTDKPVSP